MLTNSNSNYRCAFDQVLLNAIDISQVPVKTTFNCYAQSSHCVKKQDSSVSYASAVVREQADGK